MMPPRRILISALALPGIGTGHLRRMMTLAEVLLDRPGLWLGVQTTALGVSILRASGLDRRLAAVLTAPDAPEAAMADLRDQALRLGCDTLVLDNYHWQAETEAPLRAAGFRLCVIDDLADRPHLADVLIDQNANQTPERYRGLVPETCRLGVGAGFCLLARPFREMRAAGGPDPEARLALDQVFLSLGGGDPGNDLLPLARMVLAHTQMRLSIACGSHVRDAAALGALAAAHPGRVDLALDSDRVAAQMQGSAVALAAGGTMTWERAALGLPTLCLVIADNQEATARWMTDQGLQASFDLRGAWSETGVAAAFTRFLADHPARLHYARATAALIPPGSVDNAAALVLGG